MKKDTQRSKAYRAEDMGMAGCERYSTFAEAKERALKIAEELGLFHSGFRRMPNILQSNDRSSWASKSDWAIKLGHGSYHWSDHIIIHELSHLMVPHTFPGHGIEWRQQFVVNVAKLLGKEQGLRLQDAFERSGLPVFYDKKHQSKVRADFNWRAKRPAIDGWGDGKTTYQRIQFVLKSGALDSIRSTSDGWPVEKLDALKALVEAGEVAYVS